jgi:hypothetical protein
LLETSRGFGFNDASLVFDDRYLSARLGEADAVECWELHIPLNHSGHVHFRVPLHSQHPPETISGLVTSVGEVFANKLAALTRMGPAPSQKEVRVRPWPVGLSQRPPRRPGPLPGSQRVVV